MEKSHHSFLRAIQSLQVTTGVFTSLEILYEREGTPRCMLWKYFIRPHDELGELRPAASRLGPTVMLDRNQCRICGLSGHWGNECPELQQEQKHLPLTLKEAVTLTSRSAVSSTESEHSIVLTPNATLVPKRKVDDKGSETLGTAWKKRRQQ